MGHVGLTPQSLHQLGGFKVQGRTEPQRARILAGARALAEAGAYAMVLEGMPAALAAEVTAAVPVPHHRHRRRAGLRRPGAGDARSAGPGPGWSPRFVRRYAELGSEIERAFAAFAEDVRSRQLSRRGGVVQVSTSLRRRCLRRPGRDDAPGPMRRAAAGERIVLVPTMGGAARRPRGAAGGGPPARRPRWCCPSSSTPPSSGPRRIWPSTRGTLEARSGQGRGAPASTWPSCPPPAGMYPPGFQTYVEVRELQKGLCGERRPGHFVGVATVVAKLFNIVRPARGHLRREGLPAAGGDQADDAAIWTWAWRSSPCPPCASPTGWPCPRATVPVAPPTARARRPCTGACRRPAGRRRRRARGRRRSSTARASPRSARSTASTTSSCATPRPWPR